MKGKKNLAILYYMVSVVWFGLAIMYYVSEKSSNLGTTYLAIGSMWLCLGGAFMNRVKRREKTVQYYNENAVTFTEGTANADMSAAREVFTKYLPKKALILDWGCGSGRDSKAFKAAGFKVEAVDASEEMCKIASEYAGIEVRKECFDELNATDKYDGIWACASLLHVEKEYLSEILETAGKALKVEGVMYASFKYGTFDGERNGRHFTDMTEDSFAKLLKSCRRLETVEQWVTEDVRPEKQEQWLNVIVKRIK